MEPIIPVGNGQEAESEPDPDRISSLIITQCLSEPEILSAVLDYFTNHELTELSRVNEQWKYEAHRVLKSRGNFYATTEERNTCQDIEDFATGLQFMRIMPFAGINIKLCGQHDCSGQGLNAAELDAICDEIIDRIPCRILAVQCSAGWAQHQQCPGFVLLKKILERRGPALQELSLVVVDDQSVFIRDALPAYTTLPNLKTLKFEDLGDYTISKDYTNLIKELVFCAPNLEKLHTRGRVDLKGNLLKGSKAVHVTDYPYSLSRDEIPESAVGSLRMKQIKLDFGENFNLERFNSIFFKLLDASLTTLTHVHIDFPFFLPLMGYKKRLKSVRELKIHVNIYIDLGFENQSEFHLIKSFDFNHMFPSLASVEIKAEHHSLSFASLRCRIETFIGVVAQGQRRARNIFRARKIKTLNVQCDSWFTRAALKFLAQMFPNTQRLWIRAKSVIAFDVIWSCWCDLKELHVTFTDRQVEVIERERHNWDFLGLARKNFPGLSCLHDASNISEYSDPCQSLKLDGAFCGIHPDEVATLRALDNDEDLRRLCIPPQTPSITNLRNLQTLTIFLESTRTDLWIDPLIWFSKVTPLVAFRSCPNLEVTIKTNDDDIEKALSHLNPYLHQPVALDNLN